MDFKQLNANLPKNGAYVGVTETYWDDERRTDFIIYKDIDEMKHDIISKSKNTSGTFSVVWIKPVTYSLTVDIKFAQDEW